MPTSPLDATLQRLRGLAGGEPVATPWERFDQDAVTAYGAMTGEDLWIHSDPIRAAASPFGGTIVQASLLMARFGAWLREAGFWLPDPAAPLNYGFDQVRILQGLPTGAPVRGRLALRRVEDRAGMALLHMTVTVERDDGGRSVMVADWIVAFVLPG